MFYPARGLDKVQPIAVMLFNTGCNCKHVGIKNNIFCGKAHLIDQNIVAALANLFATLKVIRLTLLIKRHYHNCGTMLLAQSSSLNKLWLAFLKADGVYDRLTLYTFKTRFDHLPFGGIDHNRHSRNIRLRGN